MIKMIVTPVRTERKYTLGALAHVWYDAAMLKHIQTTIRAAANPRQAAIAQRFFKTKKGEYGYGDVFLGLMVPVSRKIAKQFALCPLGDVEKLLRSKIHEERFIALIILITQFEKGTAVEQKKIFDLYLRSTRYINNWDLVDVSAPRIVGGYLSTRKRLLLKKLARSKSLWERRIAIIATLYFITDNEFDDTLAIAELLVHDTHDLIHKAVGWMLREVGKRSLAAERAFLDSHAHHMPRTMLRYAIERFPSPLRQQYLAK